MELSSPGLYKNPNFFMPGFIFRNISICGSKGMKFETPLVLLPGLTTLFTRPASTGSVTDEKMSFVLPALAYFENDCAVTVATPTTISGFLLINLFAIWFASETLP